MRFHAIHVMLPSQAADGFCCCEPFGATTTLSATMCCRKFPELSSLNVSDHAKRRRSPLRADVGAACVAIALGTGRLPRWMSAVESDSIAASKRTKRLGVGKLYRLGPYAPPSRY